jgi:hypothetical protein
MAGANRIIAVDINPEKVSLSSRVVLQNRHHLPTILCIRNSSLRL